MATLSRAEFSALETFRSRLAHRFASRLTRLSLFGSRARGEGREDSDLDVLVVVHAGTASERRWVQDTGADVSLERSLLVSPLFVATADWPEHPLRAVIDREGRAL